MVSIDMPKLADGPFWGADGQPQSVGVKPRYGSGCFTQVVSFRSGVSIAIQDYSLYGDGGIWLFPGDNTLPVISFFSCFSGVEHISYASPRFPLGDGFSNIEFSEYGLSLSMKVKSNTPIRTLIVCMEPEVFVKLTGKSYHKLAENLEFIDRSAGEKGGLTRLKSLDFSQKICGYQALASFVDNPRDTLFLEAKALEMVALQLRQLEHLTGKTAQKQPVDHHAEKIYYACEILRKEMVGPPKILELARRVGLNHNHLIQGFREMFGLSPFGYLRIIRLEKARHLITSHECNVTEAAFSVGYSSLSHFTKSFREEFGMNPKACA